MAQSDFPGIKICFCKTPQGVFLTFVDVYSSEQHPIPTLFPRKNFGEALPLKRSRKSIEKREALNDINNNTTDCQPEVSTMVWNLSTLSLLYYYIKIMRSKFWPLMPANRE